MNPKHDTERRDEFDLDFRWSLMPIGAMAMAVAALLLVQAIVTTPGSLMDLRAETQLAGLAETVTAP